MDLGKPQAQKKGFDISIWERKIIRMQKHEASCVL